MVEKKKEVVQEVSELVCGCACTARSSKANTLRIRYEKKRK